MLKKKVREVKGSLMRACVPGLESIDLRWWMLALAVSITLPLLLNGSGHLTFNFQSDTEQTDHFLTALMLC